jgi:hypothetical protein
MGSNQTQQESKFRKRLEASTLLNPERSLGISRTDWQGHSRQME